MPKEIDEIQIEKDLKAIDEKIASLNREKEIILASKKYLKSVPPINGKKAADGTIKKRTPINQDGNFTSFVLNFLKNNKASTTTIISGWAKKTGKDNQKVGRYVSKALARLKTAEKIDNEVDSRGKRYGSNWFLKN